MTTQITLTEVAELVAVNTATLNAFFALFGIFGWGKKEDTLLDIEDVRERIGNGLEYLADADRRNTVPGPVSDKIYVTDAILAYEIKEALDKKR